MSRRKKKPSLKKAPSRETRAVGRRQQDDYERVLCNTKALDVFDLLKRVWSAKGLLDKRNPQVVEHRDYWAVYEDEGDSQWAVIVRKDWGKGKEGGPGLLGGAEVDRVPT